MTADLVAFMNARLDEEESHLDIVVEAEVESVRHDGMPDTTVQEVKNYWLSLGNESEWPRHLADIAAKRAILALHAHYVEQKRESAKYSDTWQPDEGCQTCHWDNDCNCIENSGYPCDTVKLLASVYADHEDYQPEWRL